MSEDLDSAPFWQALGDGVLRLQYCEACDRCRFPAMPACPYCGDEGFEWGPVDDTGTLYSFIRVHRHLGPASRSLELPYSVAVVELDAGPRLLGRVARGSVAEIGKRVRVVPVTVDGESHLEFVARGDNDG